MSTFDQVSSNSQDSSPIRRQDTPVSMSPLKQRPPKQRPKNPHPRQRKPVSNKSTPKQSTTKPVSKSRQPKPKAPQLVAPLPPAPVIDPCLTTYIPYPDKFMYFVGTDFIDRWHNRQIHPQNIDLAKSLITKLESGVCLASEQAIHTYFNEICSDQDRLAIYQQYKNETFMYDQIEEKKRAVLAATGIIIKS